MALDKAGLDSCREPEYAKPIDARGLCHTHYERWRRTGSTAPPVRRIVPAAVRFAGKFRVDPETECHIWTGSRDERGYGLFRVTRLRVVRSHIFAWEQKNGPVPDGLELDHFRCDNPPCCNPDHLRPVTTRENGYRSDNVCQGWRICKPCSRERQRRYRTAKKAAG